MPLKMVNKVKKTTNIPTQTIKRIGTFVAEKVNPIENGKNITIGIIYFKSLVDIIVNVARNTRIYIPTMEL